MDALNSSAHLPWALQPVSVSVQIMTADDAAWKHNLSLRMREIFGDHKTVIDRFDDAGDSNFDAGYPVAPKLSPKQCPPAKLNVQSASANAVRPLATASQRAVRASQSQSQQSHTSCSSDLLQWPLFTSTDRRPSASGVATDSRSNTGSSTSATYSTTAKPAASSYPTSKTASAASSLPASDSANASKSVPSSTSQSNRSNNHYQLVSNANNEENGCHDNADPVSGNISAWVTGRALSKSSNKTPRESQSPSLQKCLAFFRRANHLIGGEGPALAPLEESAGVNEPNLDSSDDATIPCVSPPQESAASPFDVHREAVEIERAKATNHKSSDNDNKLYIFQSLFGDEELPESPPSLPLPPPPPPPQSQPQQTEAIKRKPTIERRLSVESESGYGSFTQYETFPYSLATGTAEAGPSSPWDQFIEQSPLPVTDTKEQHFPIVDEVQLKQSRFNDASSDNPWRRDAGVSHSEFRRNGSSSKDSKEFHRNYSEHRREKDSRDSRESHRRDSRESRRHSRESHRGKSPEPRSRSRESRKEDCRDARWNSRESYPGDSRGTLHRAGESRRRDFSRRSSKEFFYRDDFTERHRRASRESRQGDSPRRDRESPPPSKRIRLSQQPPSPQQAPLHPSGLLLRLPVQLLKPQVRPSGAMQPRIQQQQQQRERATQTEEAPPPSRPTAAVPPVQMAAADAAAAAPPAATVAPSSLTVAASSSLASSGCSTPPSSLERQWLAESFESLFRRARDLKQCVDAAIRRRGPPLAVEDQNGIAGAADPDAKAKRHFLLASVLFLAGCWTAEERRSNGSENNNNTKRTYHEISQLIRHFIRVFHDRSGNGSPASSAASASSSSNSNSATSSASGCLTELCFLMLKSIVDYRLFCCYRSEIAANNAALKSGRLSSDQQRPCIERLMLLYQADETWRLMTRLRQKMRQETPQLQALEDEVTRRCGVSPSGPSDRFSHLLCYLHTAVDVAWPEA